MKVLVACEFSGIVREAFAARGHDAWSCDLLPSEQPGQHLQQDIFTPDGAWALGDGWDLMIGHPPCKRIAASGAKWWAGDQDGQRQAIWFFMALLNAPVPRIAIENPVGIMSRLHRKPDQIIQPWQFGHCETKATCLWLKNLPLLRPAHVVSGRAPVCHMQSPSPDRWKNRSRTYHGIAAAMAKQWGVFS